MIARPRDGAPGPPNFATAGISNRQRYALAAVGFCRSLATPSTLQQSNERSLATCPSITMGASTATAAALTRKFTRERSATLANNATGLTPTRTVQPRPSPSPISTSRPSCASRPKHDRQRQSADPITTPKSAPALASMPWIDTQDESSGLISTSRDGPYNANGGGCLGQRRRRTPETTILRPRKSGKSSSRAR